MFLYDAECMAGSLRVVVIDDHQVFGVSLARALSDEDDIEIVGVAISMATAPALVTPDVDVALCDFRLADGDGVSLTRSMLQQCPQLKVVMLTASNDDAVLAAALEAGCAGFVTKSEPLATVVHAVRSAAVGEAVIKRYNTASAPPCSRLVITCKTFITSVTHRVHL